MTQSQTAWQETVVLPVGYVEEGNGRVYREATLRKMTGNEEALLADPKLRSNGGKLITALLGSCVTALEEVEKINPADIRRLFSADRNYLLLELRRLTFGDEMEAHYRCPRCQGVTTAIEDLAALEVRRVDDCDTSPEIPVILQDGYRDPDGRWHHELVFGLPTGEDEEAAGSHRDGNPARQRDALLARCLKQVGDLESRRIQAMGIRILAEISMADRRLIQKALDDAAPGPDLTRRVICDHCGEEYRTTLDMNHFFPLG
jgi:hypothetical protein